MAISDKLMGMLRELNVDPEVIAYINNLSEEDPKLVGQVVNELRHNPHVTVNHLEGLLASKVKDPSLPEERAQVMNFPPPFAKWILVWCRKLRQGKRQAPDPEDNPAYHAFLDGLNHLLDWYQVTQPDIVNYTPQQAQQEADEWHQTMIGEGAGKVYEPVNPKNIIYGPKWQNPDFDGWTIQRVASENDLQVEGGLMKHCVGGYYNQVEQGESQVFSLRDPKNEPHITIELDKEGKLAKQIKGATNAGPNRTKKLYKDMVAEWVRSGQGPEAYGLNFNAIIRAGKYGGARDLFRALHNIEPGMEDYGFKVSIPFDTIAEQSLLEAGGINDRETLSTLVADLVGSFTKYQPETLDGLEHQLRSLWRNDLKADKLHKLVYSQKTFLMECFEEIKEMRDYYKLRRGNPQQNLQPQAFNLRNYLDRMAG